MRAFVVQNPTVRPSYWKTRPERTVMAESRHDAAICAAKGRGSGQWWVNVKDLEDRSQGLYVSILVKIGGAA